MRRKDFMRLHSTKDRRDAAEPDGSGILASSVFIASEILVGRGVTVSASELDGTRLIINVTMAYSTNRRGVVVVARVIDRDGMNQLRRCERFVPDVAMTMSDEPRELIAAAVVTVLADAGVAKAEREQELVVMKGGRCTKIGPYSVMEADLTTHCGAYPVIKCADGQVRPVVGFKSYDSAVAWCRQDVAIKGKSWSR